MTLTTSTVGDAEVGDFTVGTTQQSVTIFGSQSIVNGYGLDAFVTAPPDVGIYPTPATADSTTGLNSSLKFVQTVQVPHASSKANGLSSSVNPVKITPQNQISTTSIFTPSVTLTISPSLRDTWSVAFDARIEADQFVTIWSVDGTKVESLTGEVRSLEEMQLTWTVDNNDLQNVLRPALDGTGKSEVLVRSDGGFTVEDRSRGRNKVILTTNRDDPDVRPIEEWYTMGYDEEQIDQEGNTWEVEVTLAPEKEKAFDNEYNTISGSSKSQSGKEWLFSFQIGDVLTRNVQADFTRSPEGEVDTVELTTIVTSEEVRIVEESLSKLNSVNYRKVPDGPDVVEDVHPQDSNTVTVTPPSDAEVSVDPGDYVVDSWETEWDLSVYRVNMTLMPVT